MTPDASTKASRRPVAIEDIYRLEMLCDPQFSPVGDKVAFTVVRPRRAENDYASQIYLASPGTDQVGQLTNGARDESPRWSPDGRYVAFVSNRSGSNQLWVIPTTGGEAHQLTDLDGPVESPAWSPDGSCIAFTHRVAVGEDTDSAETTKTDHGAGDGALGQGRGRSPIPARKSDVLRYSRLRYKWNAEGFWDGKWRHIWMVSVTGGRACSDPVQLTSGPYDHERSAWSPDGQRLAFAADRRRDADLDNKSDIYVLDVTMRELVQVTDNDGPASSPTWSPDGTRIAYLGHTDTYDGATVTRAWVVDATGSSEPRCVTADFDRNLGAGLSNDVSWGTPDHGPVWDTDGNSLFSVAVDRGTVHLWEFPMGGIEPERLTGGQRALHGVSFGPDRSQVAFISGNSLDPGELHLLDRSSGDERVLTHFNDEVLESLALSKPETIEYRGDDGWNVQGWVMRPIGFEPGRKYPAVLKIHGGPHGAYGYAFDHHSQLLAGQGYAVVYVNPRGSTGYGQDFVKAIHHDWGGGDYRDIMAGLDHAISLGFIDEDRMAVTGLSFGGYMTDWIISHTDHFRVAVAEVTTSNRYSQWGTSDYGFGNGKWEFMSYPWAGWENARHYLERSPITYVQDINTPLLIIQAKEDHRCPLEQAEQLYTAMKVLGKECELAIFPDESHVFSISGQPAHREERLEMVLEWFGRWLGA